MGAFRLVSLRLEGFKSFAGRVELSFPGAMTAIVGPNGVGKSNICDAIAWVLGEQSARLLRSQTMADVIFAGSPKRQPLGAAEVSLVLAAGDGRWASSDGRLEITRRVYRDGTSDYRVGGKRVRLKDLAENLMDAGLGTRAYAIIEQGRIGQVLSARSTDRRALFEEAAGITKFRARRHEAELKLAETNANLVRLADVASEVRRALDGARRQARRAEKHIALRNELLGVRAGVFAARRADLTAQLDARRKTLIETEQKVAEATATLAHAEAELQRERRELDALIERLTAARADEAHCDAAAARREAEEAASRREYAEAASRREAAAVEAMRLAQLAETRATEETGLLAALAQAQDTLIAQERAAEEANTAAQSAAENARVVIAAAEDVRRALLAAAAAATEARNKVHRLEVETEQSTYQRARLSGEQERLRTHLQQTAVSENEAARKQNTTADRLREVEETRRTLRERQEELNRCGTELVAARDRAGHERWQAHHEGDGLRRQLAAARTAGHSLARVLPENKVLGTVADYLDPDSQVAQLVDRAFEEWLNLPVVADEEALGHLIEHAARLEGKTDVAIAEAPPGARPSPLLERAGVTGDNAAWLSRALPRAEVARDLAHARELAEHDPDLVVLLPGGGRRRGNRVELPGERGTVPGVLELRLLERDAAAREAAASLRENELITQVDENKGQLSALAEQVARADGAAREAAEAHAAAFSTHETVHRERTRLERELEALGAELDRLATESANLAARLAETRDEAQRLATRAGEIEADVDQRARLAEQARENAGNLNANAERARGEAAVGRERRTAAEREVERYRHEMNALRERVREAHSEEMSQRARAEAAAAAATTARADLEELLARRSAAHREVESLVATDAAVRQKVTAAEAEAEQRRADDLAVRDAAHAVRLQIAESSAALERLQETIALTLAGHVELPAEPPAPELLPELEAREQTLAADLEALGPVNELAVAELKELEERHQFLVEQRRDLERSLASLNETVKELDETCAQRFLQTLEQVSAAFVEVFRALFGGGEAAIELSDPDSPLDSGVEVRVRPPGKHAQSVLLLSGGEKALAAVALLLALFRVRPAPFCVLDEVDAPLDDANVERLCQLLRQMSDETQFLLVTHNRRTMAHTDVLYGVTMEEPGTSSIVSVRLEE